MSELLNNWRLVTPETAGPGDMTGRVSAYYTGTVERGGEETTIYIYTFLNHPDKDNVIIDGRRGEYKREYELGTPAAAAPEIP